MSTALVSIVDGIPTTTSLKIAETFSKSHKNVLRDIDRVLSQVSEKFGKLNFEPSSYANSQGKKQPMYLLTKDGVSFLVMGYTGEKATQFKEAYIEAFNCMERQLEAQRSAPEPLLLSTVDDRRKLNSLVREWAALSGQSFPDCWAEIHVAFDVEAIASLPVSKVTDAEDYVRARIREYTKPALPEPEFKQELAVYGNCNLWEELKEAERILKNCSAGIALACRSGSLDLMTPEKWLFHRILTKSADHAAASVMMAMQAVSTCLSIKGEIDFFKI